MSRITATTKCRLCRAEGEKLFLKGDRCFSSKCPIEKRGGVPPGMHGLKRKRTSDYGFQLRAKQKAKRIFAVNETQFRNYYLTAKNMAGLAGDNLLILLEQRLDNVIFVSGLALSKSHARQLVAHKHVSVNKQKINIASYQVQVGDKIAIDPKFLERFKDQLKANQKDFKAPAWLDLDKSKQTITINALPDPSAISKDIDTNLIIEYYSR